MLEQTYGVLEGESLVDLRSLSAGSGPSPPGRRCVAPYEGQAGGPAPRQHRARGGRRLAQHWPGLGQARGFFAKKSRKRQAEHSASLKNSGVFCAEYFFQNSDPRVDTLFANICGKSVNVHPQITEMKIRLRLVKFAKFAGVCKTDANIHSSNLGNSDMMEY